MSLTTDSLNLFDYDTGIYIPGKRFDEDGFSWFPIGNYHNKGSEWERDVHITYFERDGSIGFESNAGVRMRGMGSASNPQKSLTIYFRKEYGLEKVNYPVFKGQESNTYKRLILRNSGNDFLDSHSSSPGMPSADTLARLRAAVTKGTNENNKLQGSDEQPETVRPKFGISSLINRMSRSESSSTGSDLDRKEPNFNSETVEERDFDGLEQDKIEVPAFLRRQAN